MTYDIRASILKGQYKQRNDNKQKENKMETQEMIKNALSYAADQAEKHPESYGWAELAECFGEEDMGYFLELDEAEKSWDQVVAVLNEHVKLRSELQADVKATCW